MVFVIDVGLFALFTRSGWSPFVANCVAFGLASCVHFLLNRHLNFRNFERSIFAQARTYGVVVVVAFTVSNIVLFAGRAAGLSLVAAKLAGNVANLPLGFLAHRHLTFDRGILAAGRRLFMRLVQVKGP